MSRFTSSLMQDVELMEHVDKTLRDGDVIVNTMGKSGQTFLQMLLWSLLTNGMTDDSYLFANSPWLEKRMVHVAAGDGPLRLDTVEESIALFDSLPSPRVFKQHVEWAQVAASSNAQVRYLTVTRHIEELPYSMYQHHLATKPDYHKAFLGLEKGEDPTFEEFFEGWMDLPYRYQWFRDMWEWVQNGRAFLVRYEDMVTDVEGVARVLVKHLEWPEPTDMARVLSRTSKSYMTSTKIFGTDRFMDNFVRSGEIGKNRKQLSSDQRRRLRERCEAEFEPDLLRHLYRENESAECNLRN